MTLMRQNNTINTIALLSLLRVVQRRCLNLMRLYMSDTKTAYFEPYYRYLEKNIAREKDIFRLKTGAITLKKLHNKNRAISKKRMATLKVVSWGL